MTNDHWLINRDQWKWTIKKEQLINEQWIMNNEQWTMNHEKGTTKND